MSDTSRAPELVRNGIAALEANDLLGALKELSNAISLDPSSGLAFSRRGEVRRRMYDLTGALEDFEEALAFHPDDAYARAGQGSALALRDGYEAGAIVLDSAIRIDPRSGRGYRLRGEARFTWSRYGAAIDDLSAALERGERDASVYLLRARALLHVGNPAESIVDFSRVIELEPENAMAHHGRGQALVQVGDRLGGLQDLSIAVNLEPDNSVFRGVRRRVRRDVNDLTGWLEDVAHETLRIHKEPLDFVRSLTSLIGRASNHTRLISRLMLCTLALLETKRPVPGVLLTPAQQAEEQERFHRLIALGRHVARRELGHPTPFNLGINWALRELDAALECFIALVPPGPPGLPDQRPYHLAVAMEILSMCREACAAINTDCWPPPFCWQLLQSLVADGHYKGMARDYPVGTWDWVSYSRVPRECHEIAPQIFCAIGHNEKWPVVHSDWLAWNGETVPKIARLIYTQNAFHDMPILADALEDAGCNDAEMLAHCREPVHHHGCWVLDAVLGPV